MCARFVYGLHRGRLLCMGSTVRTPPHKLYYEHSMHKSKSSVVREESDTQTRQQTASGKSTKTKASKSNSRGSGN